ncbi:hypothetical protein BJ875DRAFT_368349 [Amylocarpus encephaloides]|uniref:Uncharacterized protein n=1 Tax=Amylocarpus encephaloides TaxID=45428 RepID=A0A9P7YQQ5_9HELO|nr:hypothetical protein BJ875DRAFT_368349 [Amylocarpus encephaloides]
MAPIRRYLRITKYSVLECRIYVDKPALAESWLLSSRNPVLPRVIESVRPLVLPKLREESERSRGKGSKKKGVKDVIVEEDFEVSIFLTDTSTRHSLLTKHKHFRENSQKALTSNSTKITGGTHESAIEVDDIPNIRREEGEEDILDIADIPAVEDEDSLFVDDRPRRSKRTRNAIDVDSSPTSSPEPAAKRSKDVATESTEGESDEKKKMTMETSYEGFAIYGRVLCLVVKRKDKRARGPSSGGGQAMMEHWITSTQMPPPNDDD